MSTGGGTLATYESIPSVAVSLPLGDTDVVGADHHHDTARPEFISPSNGARHVAHTRPTQHASRRPRNMVSEDVLVL